MKTAHLLTLCGFLLLASSDSTPLHEVSYGQTGVVLSTEHSKAECTRIAHQTCEQIFGKCAKDDGVAIGGEVGYLVMYQCHSVKMTIGSATALVIAGSRNEDTSSAKFADWMERSYSLARGSFGQ